MAFGGENTALFGAGAKSEADAAGTVFWRSSPTGLIHDAAGHCEAPSVCSRQAPVDLHHPHETVVERHVEQRWSEAAVQSSTEWGVKFKQRTKVSSKQKKVIKIQSKKS